MTQMSNDSRWRPGEYEKDNKYDNYKDSEITSKFKLDVGSRPLVDSISINLKYFYILIIFNYNSISCPINM